MRFSLRTLLLLLVPVFIGLAIGSHYARQRYEYVTWTRHIKYLGGYWNDHGASLDVVHSVYFTHTVADDDLECLQRFPRLEELWFSLSPKNSRITDAGLKHLRGMKQLKLVHFYGTQVTPEGATELRKWLPNTRVELSQPPTPDSFRDPLTLAG